MSDYEWEVAFTDLFVKCMDLYRAGDLDYLTYYDETELAFLDSIGYKRREFFDFVEDYCDEGTPSHESAVLTAAVRRDYFRTVRNGEISLKEITPDDLPGKDEELGGFQWLPRIICKARGKLEGELHPQIMFGCGGDRAFLKKHDIHPADFLRVVWSAKDDDQVILDYVKSRHA